MLAAATVVQLQEQGGGKELLTTRGPPWQRQHRSPHPLPLLLQEKPVLQLAPSMATFPSVALSSPSSSHLHLPPQGVAGSCLWRGCLCHLLAASTLTVTLLLHHHQQQQC